MGAATFAAGAPLLLFNGAADLISLDSWGSGAVALNTNTKYLNNSTLDVTTNGYFEGGFLRLRQPEDMTPALAQPENNLVVLVLQLSGQQANQGRGGRGGFGFGGGMGGGYGGGMGGPGMPPGAPGMQPGAPGMPPAPGAPGMAPGAPGAPGMPPDMTAGGMPPQPGGPMMGGPQMGQSGPVGRRGRRGRRGGSQNTSAVTRVRLMLITDKGDLDAGQFDVTNGAAQVPGWLRLVVPLSQFASLEQAGSAKLQGVVISGDQQGIIHVGQLYLKSEEPPLKAEIQGDRVINARVNQKLSFTGAPNTGNADYEWDFDYSNGLGTDALGPNASWQYDKAGSYLATLVVADAKTGRETRVDQVLVVVK
jgi:hypothetical protein